MEKLVGIKIEGFNHLRISSNEVQEKKELASNEMPDTVASDGFSRDESRKQSPFAQKRQSSPLNPYVDIGVTAKIPTGNVWWSSDLLRDLESIPEASARLRDEQVHAELFNMLKLLARDQSYLKINWRDDFN